MSTSEKELPEETIRTVEALLFSAHEPLPPSTLAPALNGTAASTLERIMVEINARLTEGSHPMRVRKVAGGYQMHVQPEFGAAIEAALTKTKIQRLSRAGLETLAIIAYKQPCSTPEIERIRGVSCGGVLSTLLERNIVMIKGRSDGPGRPLLYGTTKEFLKYFGLNNLDDLPRVEELEKILAEREGEGQTTSQLLLDGATDGEPSPSLVINRPAEPGIIRRFTIEDIVYTNEQLDSPSNGGGNGDSAESESEDTVQPEPARL